jgi:hypothetical protein
MKKTREKEIQEKGRKIQKEVKERAIGYIIGAFGFVAGLAWNEAIKAFIEVIFPLHKDSLFAKFSYALLITLVVTIITLKLLKMIDRQDEKKTKKNG